MEQNIASYEDVIAAVMKHVTDAPAYEPEVIEEKAWSPQARAAALAARKAGRNFGNKVKNVAGGALNFAKKNKGKIAAGVAAAAGLAAIARYGGAAAGGAARGIRSEINIAKNPIPGVPGTKLKDSMRYVGDAARIGLGTRVNADKAALRAAGGRAKDTIKKLPGAALDAGANAVWNVAGGVDKLAAGAGRLRKGVAHLPAKLRYMSVKRKSMLADAYVQAQMIMEDGTGLYAKSLYSSQVELPELVELLIVSKSMLESDSFQKSDAYNDLAAIYDVYENFAVEEYESEE